MKEKLKLLTIAVLVLFGLSNLQAQEAIPATGGEASGSGGSASYTVGQVVYTTSVGTNGNSIAEGVQQPYEISVITSIPEAKGISLNISAYPNPTTNYLTVKVDASTLLSIQSLQYQVFDINGKLLQTVKATGQETKIETNNLVNGNYFVKVYAVGKNDHTGIDNEKEIKVFKIIKN